MCIVIVICEVENIDYFLIGGFLFGVICYYGFILWDDDIDIGMCCYDY